jgi:hypothetical protein
MSPERHDTKEHHEEVTTMEARQGTGPRDMMSVLIVSLLLAAIAGTVLLAYVLT